MLLYGYFYAYLCEQGRISPLWVCDEQLDGIWLLHWEVSQTGTPRWHEDHTVAGHSVNNTKTKTQPLGVFPKTTVHRQPKAVSMLNCSSLPGYFISLLAPLVCFKAREP